DATKAIESSVELESVAFVLQPEIWSALFTASVIALLTLNHLSLYRVLVRFLTGKVLIPVGKGALVAAVVLYFSGLVFEAGIPRSVPIIFGLFVFLSLCGIRFIARTLFRNPAQLVKRPVIIFGAGESGLQLLNSLFHGREYAPVALVDDDPDLQHRSVGGLRVYAPEQIRQLVATTGAHVLLLAIPSISRLRRREIVDALEDLQIDIKTIPGPSEIISGKAKISELRTITAEDLLGRDPVAPDPQLLSTNITGLVVMVSGAGGSIGSELCRQILSQEPKVLVLFEVSEFALYTVEAELSATAARLTLSTKIVAVLGSVQYGRRLEETIKVFGVQTIYHAAAYKHVPLVEDNVVEGTLNNVFGTLAITSAAKKHGVDNFILVSTDKAVRPTNVMGATKRIAELICQAHAQEAQHT
ncbi:MAG: polysaccharide biosynthesis protein, partial [Verrucomicrobiaceae bacterium]